MKLNKVSLEQWQAVENLTQMVETHGLTKDVAFQITGTIPRLSQGYGEDTALYNDCGKLLSVMKTGKPKEAEILALLKRISREYKSFLKNLADSDGYKACSSDNLPRRYYRYLQTIWRESQGLPVRKKEGQPNSEVYGNYTSDPHGNFMTPYIQKLVEEELADKGDRLIDEKRMRDNLLSSQPLCFNLFGELKRDSGKALKFFNIIYRDCFSSIDNIVFEHNPARRDPRLTGDRSAFDVFVEYTSRDGKKGFIGIEVKYSETLREGADTVQDILNKQFCDEPRTRKARYEELSEGLFKREDFKLLETLPYFQIWRDHLLAVSMCKAFSDKYDEGFFMFLSPRTNIQCRKAVTGYKNLLRVKDRLASHFDIRWLEDFIDTLNTVCNEDWSREMGYRYLGRKPKPGELRELKCATKSIIQNKLSDSD